MIRLLFHIKVVQKSIGAFFALKATQFSGQPRFWQHAVLKTIQTHLEFNIRDFEILFSKL